MVVVNCTCSHSCPGADWRLLTCGPSDYHPTFTHVCTRNLDELTCPTTSSEYLFNIISRLWSFENQNVKCQFRGNRVWWVVLFWKQTGRFSSIMCSASIGGGAGALVPGSCVVSFRSTRNSPGISRQISLVFCYKAKTKKRALDNKRRMREKRLTCQFLFSGIYI